MLPFRKKKKRKEKKKKERKWERSGSVLGPSINGLVTDRIKKLGCRGFILALFQSTTANKIDSKYKRLLPYAKLKYYELQLKELMFSHLFMLTSDHFRLKVPKIAKRVPRFLADVHKDG